MGVNLFVQMYSVQTRCIFVRYGTYQLRSTVGLLYQDPKTLCYESTYQIYDMTNIGIAPCLDQVHVYIDTGYFTTTLCTATETSSTEMIS